MFSYINELLVAYWSEAGLEALGSITMPSNYLKLDLSVIFFLEHNELLMNLGELFDKFQRSMQEIVCFPFSMLFSIRSKSS